jgi:hypothetical protein
MIPIGTLGAARTSSRAENQQTAAGYLSEKSVGPSPSWELPLRGVIVLGLDAAQT